MCLRVRVRPLNEEASMGSLVKKACSFFLLATAASLLSSCVNRTITTSPALGKSKGERVVEQRMIWFWQDDFHYSK